jgi:hypothetical protein
MKPQNRTEQPSRSKSKSLKKSPKMAHHDPTTLCCSALGTRLHAHAHVNTNTTKTNAGCADDKEAKSGGDDVTTLPCGRA